MTPRRVAILILVSIPVAAEFIVGEVVFVGHIVLLIEVLGFALGLVAFIAIWAALGLAVLAVRDFVWPRMAPSFNPLLARFTGWWTDLQGRTRTKAVIVALGVACVLAAVGVAIALAGGEVKDWITDHRGDVASFLAAAAIVFAILLVMARLGRGLERWVRRIGDTAGPLMRSFAALLSMVLLGPALSWLLFRLLGFSRRAVYALTLVAAPVFGAVWVPLYGLGVWELVQGLF